MSYRITAGPRPALDSSDVLADVAGAVVRAVVRELIVSWQFVRNDLWAAVVPAVMFTAATARHAHLAPPQFGLHVVGAILYFWLYIYGFCLTNQLGSVAEDRVNKPFRPLVTGLSTAAGAWVRTGVVLVAFPIVAWRLGVLEWALLWQLLYLPHNLAGASRNWLYKDLTIGLGTTVQLAAAWQMVIPVTGFGWRWIGTLSVAVFLLIPLQDLRDLAGDTAVGRRTFPMVFGPVRTRWLLCAGFLALPFAVHFLMMTTLGHGWLVRAGDVAVGSLSVWIAVRTVRCRTPQQDHVTYRRFEQWYAVVLAVALLLF